MSKEHRPNHDLLTAYLDGALSEDATRSMGQHVERCEVCAAALEAEREFLRALDGMTRVEPPPDFVAGIMARVSQYPSYRPANPVPWRVAAGWAAAVSVLVVMIVIGGAWGLMQTEVIASADPGDRVAGVVSEAAGLGTSAIKAVRPFATQGYVLMQAVGKVVLGLVALATQSGWMVQVAILLLTVTINFAFTRLVLSYQRRN
jgi:anti-sigma factor RsiW